MNKMVSLDFDDVLYDLISLNKKFIKDNYNVDINNDDITSFTSLYELYPDILNGLWNNPTLYITGNLLSGAKDFYNKLVKLFGEDKIQIVTNSLPDIIDTKDHMIKHRFGINCDIIHCSKDNPKHLHTDGTILVDDYHGNLIPHNELNSGNSILFNYNKLKYAKNIKIDNNSFYTETYSETLAVIYLFTTRNNNEN